MTKKQLSSAAQVAKKIRQHLKKHGISAAVRSKNFSMGNSVTVKITDELPATVSAIERYCAQFRAGYFDPMTDLYEYAKDKGNGPRTKYLSVDCEYSQSIRQACWDYLRRHLEGMEEAPKNVRDAGSFYHEDSDQWSEVLLWNALRGDRDYGFWTTQKPRIKKA